MKQYLQLPFQGDGHVRTVPADEYVWEKLQASRLRKADQKRASYRRRANARGVVPRPPRFGPPQRVPGNMVLVRAINREFGIAQSKAQGIVARITAMAKDSIMTCGRFRIPGIAVLVTKARPATKTCTKMIFGKMQTVKAKNERVIVKATLNRTFKKTIYNPDDDARGVLLQSLQ